MFHKFKKILSIIIFHFNEYKYKKKYRKYFNNEFLVKNIKKIKQEDLNIFSKYIYDKEFRLLKHRYERYMNISKILVEIKKSKKEICVVEFGVYRGDSYLFFSRNLNYEKNKIIGIDTFKDFPKSNRRWKKGKFTNTSKNLVEKLLNKYNLKCKNFLIESDFNNKNLKKKIISLTNQINIFHFDCDQYESTVQALSVSKSFILNQKISYLCFDDWGCFEDQVPKAFSEFFQQHKNKIRYEIISNTFYTMYLRVNLIK